MVFGPDKAGVVGGFEWLGLRGVGGWLAEKIGVLDFAGGAVVHISSGFGALACVLVLEKRKGYGTDNMPPHNLPMTVLGAGLLWFRFNADSALAANQTTA